MNLLNVTVFRSETSTIGRAIGEWELPVLIAVNGEDRVTVIGPVPAPKGYEMPDASLEYDRLETKYKRQPNGQSFVSAVYGAGPRGRAALAAEMQRAADASAEPALAADFGDLEGVSEIRE